jgi:hypothetical protein
MEDEIQGHGEGLRRPYWVEPVEALKDVCTRFLLALLCTTGCPRYLLKIDDR